MKKICLLVLIALSVLGCKSNQEEPTIPETEPVAEDANPLIGTWKVVSTLNLSTLQFEQESKDYYHLFTEEHHMILVTPENRPKIGKFWDTMNCEEINSQLPIRGGLLKYELRGNAFYSYYISSVTADYEGKRVIDEFEFRGDTLVHRNDDYSDGQMREWKLIKIGN